MQFSLQKLQWCFGFSKSPSIFFSSNIRKCGLLLLNVWESYFFNSFPLTLSRFLLRPERNKTRARAPFLEPVFFFFVMQHMENTLQEINQVPASFMVFWCSEILTLYLSIEDLWSVSTIIIILHVASDISCHLVLKNRYWWLNLGYNPYKQWSTMDCSACRKWQFWQILASRFCVLIWSKNVSPLLLRIELPKFGLIAYVTSLVRIWSWYVSSWG